MSSGTPLQMMDHATSLGQHEGLARQTYQGMAHFASSGPAMETCRTCEHWKFEGRYFSKTGRHGGQLKPCICRKFKELMSGTEGPPVPHDARACKYWQLSPSPRLERDKR